MPSTGDREALIKQVWRERPRGFSWPASEVVVLQKMPDLAAAFVQPRESIGLKRPERFEFQIERSRGVGTYGQPQVRERIICEGVVLEERFLTLTSFRSVHSDPPTL